MKNKRKIERDLNKMEFKVKQVQDTREKIQIRHIKGMDIMENEVHRIMPNSLTQKIEPSKFLDDQQEEEAQKMIRKDLENVDDFFAANVWSAGLGHLGCNDSKEEPDEGLDERTGPQVEWLDSDEDNNDKLENMSQDSEIQRLEQERQKLLLKYREDIGQQTLVQQVMDLKISERKRRIKNQG
jgi:hypothetical protein